MCVYRKRKEKSVGRWLWWAERHKDNRGRQSGGSRITYNKSDGLELNQWVKRETNQQRGRSVCVCSVGLMLFSVGGEGEGEMIFF